MADQRVGICGDTAPQFTAASPTLWCDLLAGHTGWHGATAPGMEVIGVRTNWSNGQDALAAAEARGAQRMIDALRGLNILEIAVAHQRRDNGGGCHCGWNELGLSYCTHLLEQIATALVSYFDVVIPAQDGLSDGT